ncbi:MAG: hypothetical protein M2R45_03555 [Verrucomicrobia subdivision 3 bacterium]|nr:hypothetical protein [Limisphaerales bacterium]MCS1416468.1 hypothetical protein [Limisphaerales bacterium]
MTSFEKERLVFIAFRHLVHSRPTFFDLGSHVCLGRVFIAFRHLVHSRHDDFEKNVFRAKQARLHCLSAFSSFTTTYRLESRDEWERMVFIAFRHLVHSRPTRKKPTD